MKRATIIFIAIAAFLIFPFIYILGGPFIASLHSPTSYLTVKELKGVDNVFIDGKSLGKTPLLNTPIVEGIHDIKVISETNGTNYYVFDKQISFISNTNNIVTVQLGPSYTYSFYNFLYFKSVPKGSGILVNANEYDPSDSTLTLNNAKIDNNYLLFKPGGNYTIVYQKSGYLGISNQITITDGYIVFDVIHLFRKPI